MVNTRAHAGELRMLVLLLGLVGVSLSQQTEVKEPLRIGAWNVQRLGKTKMGKPEVVAVLVQVLRRYDVVVVMEVVDSTQEVPFDLLDILNDDADPGDTYSLALSPRVGSSTYKEQYAFYWKPSRVTWVANYTHVDLADNFIYDPFGVTFNTTAVNEPLTFGVVGIHTRPDDAPQEIDALADLYDDFVTTQGVDNVMIIGDYNAGCSYVTESEWEDIRLRQDSRFNWLISDSTDTTTSYTNCPYDRIVVAGSNMAESLYLDSARPFYFDKELDITDKDLVDSVSDHYPVEVMVRGEVSASAAASVENVSTAVCVDVNTTTADIVTMQNQLSDCPIIVQDCVVVKRTVSSTTNLNVYLNNFASAHPKVLSPQAVSVLQYKLSQGVLNDDTVYEKRQDSPDSYSFTMLCRVNEGICTACVSAATIIN